MNPNGTSSGVVTRVAPSPTGLFHVGTARTALFNYLFAKRAGGRFLVRIEDTDKSRSTKEYEDDILTGMRLLGLVWDDMVRQSERIEQHTEQLQHLVDLDRAYISREPLKSDPSKEVEVVRLRNPGRTVTFHDEVRGDITFDTAELGDFVIARSLTDPLYHFAVVVDDADMGVTHVIRGEDHISNTPRQILIQEALDLPRPTYAHLPLILAQDRSKMSKRKGATAVADYVADGYLPEALINFLAMLGWNPGTDQEVFTLDELIAAFSLDGVQKGGAVFDIVKLQWLNKQHRSHLSLQEQRDLMLPHAAHVSGVHDALFRSDAAMSDVLERYATGKELREAVDAGEFSYYDERPKVTETMLAWKKDPAPERTRERLEHVLDLLRALDDDAFTRDNVHRAVIEYAEKEGKGNVLWPLRMALSGKDRSPDPFVLAEALGRIETTARIEAAVVACT
jgi:nondiscriminating glutamyl-tRNA synthetase